MKADTPPRIYLLCAAILALMILLMCNGCTTSRMYVPDDVRHVCRDPLTDSGINVWLDVNRGITWPIDTLESTHRPIGNYIIGEGKQMCAHDYVEILSTDPTSNLVISVYTTSPGKECICIHCHARTKCY